MTETLRKGCVVKIKDNINGAEYGTIDFADLPGIPGARAGYTIITPANLRGTFDVSMLEDLEFVRVDQSSVDPLELSEEEIREQIEGLQIRRRSLSVESSDGTKKVRVKLSAKSPTEQLETLLSGMSKEEREAFLSSQGGK